MVFVFKNHKLEKFDNIAISAMAERAAKNIQELNAFVRNMGCLMSLMCLISV